jgi:hypothetical protein
LRGRHLKYAAVLAAALHCAGAGAATLALGSVEQGKVELTRRDDYIARLSPFDRAARLKSGRAVDEATHLAFLGASVRDWASSPHRQRVAAAAARVEQRFAALGVPVPDAIIVTTSGEEEGGAAYTRGRAIVLPDPILADAKTDLARLIAHEAFHVMTRRDAALRDRLYRLIGFEPCPELVVPDELAERTIANPDAPRNAHQIKVVYQGQPAWAVPLIYSSEAKYDPALGGTFFDYLQFRLALRDPFRLVPLNEVQGFFEQVGLNTQYIIHPEEILADNFAFAVVEKPGLRTPELPRQVVDTLRPAPGGR